MIYKTIVSWISTPAVSVFVFVTALTVLLPATAVAQIEFDEARVLIEINTTDGDAGFQAMVDGEGWSKVKIFDPNDKELYIVKGKGSVGQQGLTENFFESAEPSCVDDPLEDFLARFPAGEYTFEGKTIENTLLEGEATLTHNLPGGLENLAPNPDDGLVNSAEPIVLSWTMGDTLGTDCVPGDADVTILSDPEDLFGFQVVVEREIPEPLLVFTVDLPATAASVTVPPEFVMESGLYKWEVIAIEDNDGERGNQSISESHFCTTGFVGDCEPD